MGGGTKERKSVRRLAKTGAVLLAAALMLAGCGLEGEEPSRREVPEEAGISPSPGGENPRPRRLLFPAKCRKRWALPFQQRPRKLWVAPFQRSPRKR